MVLQVFKKSENSNGIWFFGRAGAGKTFASRVCKKIIDNAFIIDGDDVRELISFDLGFSKSDREIQIKNLFSTTNTTKEAYCFTCEDVEEKFVNNVDIL